jgi:hypothetical protein
MTTSLFRSPVFWGGLAAVAVGTGAYLHHKRGYLLGRSNPAPVLVKKNGARMPVPVETRTEGGVTMRRYEMASMSIDERLKLIQARVWDGVNDPRIRKLALQITRQCGRDDGACEAQRVFDYVKANVRYTGDIGPVLNPKTGKVEAIDLYQKPWVTLEYGGGDCLPLDTYVLRHDFELVTIAELTAGDQIMADGAWTTVRKCWATGDKPVLELDLANGSTLRCTAEHRIFRSVGGRIEEIRAAEARVGDDLVTAEQLPFAQVDVQANPAPVLAYTRTADAEQALVRLAKAAAPPKYPGARRGQINAVCAAQLRVASRMLGHALVLQRTADMRGEVLTIGAGLPTPDAAWSRVIPPGRWHIVGVQVGTAATKVTAIRDGGVVPCGDLTTDRGKFWLPESDTIVHNCDDHVGVVASLLTVIGHTVRLRVSASSRFGDWEHIYPATILPKHAPKLARAVDTTLPWNAKLGSEAKYGKARDYTIEAPV